MRRRQLIACCVGMLLIGNSSAAEQAAPLDVLRTNIARGVAVLQDPQYKDTTQRETQREHLCAIGREVFDPYLFAKLALGSNWRKFSADEQDTFVEVFAAYLCRYYLSRLQQRYSDQQVDFSGQQFESDTRATVKALVLWQDARIPVEIRMALRDGHWRAYDMSLLGVSAVKVYRTQFNDVLSHATPAELIARLREQTARNE